MSEAAAKYAPGKVRDAIVEVLLLSPRPLSVKEIERRVCNLIGATSSSSIRSYLRLNTPGLFVREERGIYSLDGGSSPRKSASSRQVVNSFEFGESTLYLADCLEWLETRHDHSIEAVVTDPPYGLQEYSDEQQKKLRNGKGGVWRIPPSYDGHARSPLPRFTTLTQEQLLELHSFFLLWGQTLLPKLVPGANVVVASNPLLSHIVSDALAKSGLERRGEIVRLTMTMRGGDRPKGAHKEFSDVSVMPRSMWEPWLVFRTPLEGTVKENLKKWGTGGFRRISAEKPFGDVIQSGPTRAAERDLANHPSLKPQSFMRQIVRGVLPLGEGVVVDPFAGSGSTLAAAEAIGYRSIGVERDPEYFKLATAAIPRLANYLPNHEFNL